MSSDEEGKGTPSTNRLGKVTSHLNKKDDTVRFLQDRRMPSGETNQAKDSCHAEGAFHLKYSRTHAFTDSENNDGSGSLSACSTKNIIYASHSGFKDD